MSGISVVRFRAIRWASPRGTAPKSKMGPESQPKSPVLPFQTQHALPGTSGAAVGRVQIRNRAVFPRRVLGLACHSRCRRVHFDVEARNEIQRQFYELRTQQESQTMTDADVVDSRYLFFEG